MTTFRHGVTVQEVDDGTRSISTVSTAIIGFVATAQDADAVAFPLNTPVLLTNLKEAIGKAGVQGTLAKTLIAIDAQCTPVAVVVRVAEGANPAETTTNVIGGVTQQGMYTGMQALLAASARLKVTPRILGAPGLDTQAVAAALAIIAQKLRGFAYVSANGAVTKEAATTYRAQFGQRELMVVWPDFLAWNSITNQADTIWAPAVALGLRAKIDEQTGWHKTISNVPVNGVTGISRDIHWDLQSSSNDAGYLNSLQVTTLIQSDGYRFWGNRTCSADPKWAFESSVRTSQVMGDTMAYGLMWASDKPLHPTLGKDILETINAKLREMTTNGYIHGGFAWIDKSANTPDVLQRGQLVIDVEATPMAPAEHILIRQRFTSRFLLNFVNRTVS